MPWWAIELTFVNSYNYLLLLLTSATLSLRRGPKDEAIARLLLAPPIENWCTPGWVYYEVMREGVHEYTSTPPDSQPTYFGPFMIMPLTPSLASNSPLRRLLIAVLALFGVLSPLF